MAAGTSTLDSRLPLLLSWPLRPQHLSEAFLGLHYIARSKVQNESAGWPSLRNVPLLYLPGHREMDSLATSASKMEGLFLKGK